MYKIIKEGEVIGLVESPNYIRLSDNGTYVPTDVVHAQGVAYDSTPYNLPGNDMPNLETVSFEKTEMFDIVQQLKADIDFTAAMGGFEL